MRAMAAREPQLPPPVHANLDDTILDYWMARVAQHERDWYMGVRLLKFPEDLRVYEHLLWDGPVDVVVELGSGAGGSALWFRDRLSAYRAYGRNRAALVVSVDVDISRASGNVEDEEGIVLVEGDLRDPSLPDRVAAAVPPGARCLVVEDGPHTYEATFAGLDGFAPLVPRGGWYVVEDGVVDEGARRISDDWPRGVQRAIGDWLATPAGGDFSCRRDLEAYGITTNTSGYLMRTGGAHARSSR
jgi:cephalosporin hydroxylase